MPSEITPRVLYLVVNDPYSHLCGRGYYDSAGHFITRLRQTHLFTDENCREYWVILPKLAKGYLYDVLI
jgi:hypothetical protein